MAACQTTVRDQDHHDEEYLQGPFAKSHSITSVDHIKLQYGTESATKRRRLYALGSKLDLLPTTSFDHHTNAVQTNHGTISDIVGSKRSYDSLEHDDHHQSEADWPASQSLAQKDYHEASALPVTTYQCDDHVSLADGQRHVSGEKVGSESQETSSALNNVCYGMLRNLERFRLPETVFCPGEVRYQNSTIYFSCGTSVQLSQRTGNILGSLTNAGGTLLELSCEQLDQDSITLTLPKTRLDSTNRLFTLNVVIYGPKDVAEGIGDWLASVRLHLQAPTSCKFIVPYHNPHKMSDESTIPIMTDQLNSKNVASQNPKTFDQDALRQLYTTRSFNMSPQPLLLKTSLQPHQREALTFMQHREAIVDMRTDLESHDLWKHEVDAFGRKRYVEVLTGQSFVKMPPHCRGGLLADEMGLGKTCTMLALIASDMSSNSAERGRGIPGGSSPDRDPTLIIVPLPLLHVWEKQIQRHLVPGAVRSCTFYGTHKNNVTSFNDLDIVLTTYDTVSGEHRRSGSHPTGSPSLMRHWHRLVLDEAHVIKNKDTDVAKAVTSLTADRKWCITGTPIQNRMSDLFSLLRFLHVYPYNEFRKFDQVFLQPWRNAQTEALHKLQYLMSVLAIRRPRTTISLPFKVEIIIPVVLGPQERHVYEQTKQGLVEIFDAALDSAENVKLYYLNALQRINDLRYVCNHGKAPQRARSLQRPPLNQNVDTLQQELSLLFGREAVETHSSYVKVGDPSYLQVPSSRCSASTSRNSPGSMSSAETVDDDFSTMTMLTTNEMPSPVSDSMIPDVSSKISALVDDINCTPPSEKCVVFSFWTTTLSQIARALDSRSISNIRYDGSMSRSKRDAVLENFSRSTAGQYKVILVSISSGGQGLDLTAANHAYLVEPQWNPMAEEQALSRVYRLGQTQPVRLCRLVAEDTWEQRIVGLQEKKRKLAELIVDRVALDRKGSQHGPEPDSRAHVNDARRLLAWLRDLVS